MEGWGKVRAAAKYGGVSERTFRDWLRSGLKHSRIPSGTVLIQYADIDEFLKSFEAAPEVNPVDKIVDDVLRDLQGKD